MTDLELARVLEFEILTSNPPKGSCGCNKLAQCPFPGLGWYYVTLCPHDSINPARALTPVMERYFWWYDIASMKLVSVPEFKEAYRKAMSYQCGYEGAPGFVRIHVGTVLFEIGRGGQVRNIGGNRAWSEWK